MFNRFMHLNGNSVLIGYNLIGLPSKTHFYTGNIIYTDYAADGRKLQTRYVYDSNEVAVIESDGGDDISGSGDLDELFGSMAAVGGSVAQPDGGLIPGGDLINFERFEVTGNVVRVLSESVWIMSGLNCGTYIVNNNS